MQFLFRQAWFGRFGFVVLVLVGLVVCFGRFGSVVFIWQVSLGRFGFAIFCSVGWFCQAQPQLDLTQFDLA